MGYMLETRGLTKRFGRGDQAQEAVADVSLHIREGEVYGLLGPNGAGKSTTLKMICGMLRPTAGEILFAGHAWRREDLYAIGSLIEEAPLYPNLTARENLRVRTTLLGLPESRIDEVLAAVDLADTGKKRAGRFSMGMRQRLELALALIARPRLLVLDEPTNGLDPIGIEELRDQIRGFAAAGTTVIVSSHILSEVQQMADTPSASSTGGASPTRMQRGPPCGRPSSASRSSAEAAQIARARGVTLDAATGPAVAGAPEAPLDRTALARAAANLVANAAEHARSRVAVSCDVEGGHLVIEVSDDGPGFSPAALERGCERLFTDDSSRSSRDGGRHYGLGLHAASEAASAHGGSVSLANSPSGGLATLMWTVPGGAQETGGPYMRDPRHPRHFTDEFKRQIVDLYNAGKPKREIMDEYDLGKSTVERWIKSINATGSPRAADNRTPEQNRILELERENRRLRMEVDVLKQAALIYARK